MVLAACGDDSGGTATTGGTAAGRAYDYGGGGSAATTTAAPATTAAAAATVKVTKTPLGDILTDDKGRTLYIFLKDTANTSACTGACLNTWPRYAPAAVTAGAGVDASKLGTITVDGVKQATIGGLPLYYFAGDTAAGDTKGQGTGGNWYVVDATGAAKKT
jgi:predicted lipoprotein with Yx(FWY)xxD motif